MEASDRPHGIRALHSSISRAVILAAGNGTRLAGFGRGPKPLLQVAGRPLLEHVLRTAAYAGIREAFVVTGFGASRLRAHPFDVPSSLSVQWVENPHYERANGVSVLCAEPHVRGSFLLLMADHLVAPAIVRRLLKRPLVDTGIVAAVDRKISTVFDLPDATKVLERNGELMQIGKSLASYNAIDTGMFLCSPQVFSAIRESVSAGRDELSHGIAKLAQSGSARTWSIGSSRWIDVDTVDAWKRASEMVDDGLLVRAREVVPVRSKTTRVVASRSPRSRGATRRVIG